jgi:hypothetical protein
MQGYIYKMRRLKDDKGIYDPGITWGYGRNAYPKIVLEVKPFILIRVPGLMNWAGRGNVHYTQPYFILLKILGRVENKYESYEEMQEIEEYEYTKVTKSMAYNRAIERLEELKREQGDNGRN